MMDKEQVKKLVKSVYDSENELQNYIVEQGEPLGFDPIERTKYSREMNVLNIADHTNKSNIELLNKNK